MDDVSDIAEYYNNDPERECARLEEHRLEHDLTWRFLDQYLPARGTILEIGAATGRYTVALARRGYTVTAVDLSAALLERCRQVLAEAGLERQVRLLVADARDLGRVTEREFDAVLLMGPLYHLVVEADRKMALRQAFGRLREGGVIFSSFISRFGVIGDLLKNLPDWIERQAEVEWLLEKGRRPDDQPRGGFRGYFARAPEIAPLHEALGFETMAVAGIEPAISADDESYNRLEGEQRRLWLDLLYEMTTEATSIGASRHLLYIGRKPTSRPQLEASAEFYAQTYDLSVPDWPGEIDFYQELAMEARRQERSVLEIACGTGRVAIRLAQAGVDLVGLDCSPQMLAVAREKSAGLANMRWVEADMRSFELGQKFELAIIPGQAFHNLNTPQDQAGCLECIGQHLRPGGRLVIHLDPPDYPWLGALLGEKGGQFEPAEQFAHPESGRPVRASRAWSYEPASQTATCQTVWEEVDAGGRVVNRWQRGPTHLHSVFRFEMEHLLARAGFVVEAVYGDFFRRPYVDKSPEMIWVARR